MHVRTATPDDFPWIIDLIDRHRGVDLSAEERARQGFVQGHWDISTLARLAPGPGFLVAEIDGTRAGVALSSAPGAAASGPARRTNDLAAAEFGPASYFLYGPVVVEDGFRGKGVLKALTEELLRRNEQAYTTAVAFIEASNLLSMTVHERLGWQVFADFELEGRAYRALGRTTRRGAGS